MELHKNPNQKSPLTTIDPKSPPPMEPRSPFHHHHPQPPGYVSLPPPPRPPPPPPHPYDGNLYHRHQPHRLPPPPPLPPVPPPSHHNHPPLYLHPQQNPRKPHTPNRFPDRLPDRFPDRLPDRIPDRLPDRPKQFNHHHQYYQEQQHVRREVWDHPTRQIHQQNHPIVVFDPEHEHPHHDYLHHHQNRSKLVAMDRFEDVDDHSDLEVIQLPEGFEVEDLYLPPLEKGYRGNNSSSSNSKNVYYSNHPRNVLIDSELDSGDFHIVSDEMRVDYERKVGSLGRNQSVSHNSVMEIENEGLGWEYEVRDNRVRNVSGKRARIGKYKDVVESEEYEEFVRSPHKKVQRPSVLHRVQLGKNHYRNWKNDEYEYFEDPNDGGFSNQGPIVFSDQRQEEVRGFGGRGRSRLFPRQRQEQEREFSGKRPMGYSNPIQSEVREARSVELDVSFKSNTLVAKTIVSSSNQYPFVSGDGASTPNSKKRKAIVPLLSVSSPRVTAIREKPLNAPKKNWNASSSTEKLLTQSKDKATSGIQSGVAVGSQFRPNAMRTSMPPEQSKPKAAHTGTGVSVKSQPSGDGESISAPLQKSVGKSPLSAVVGSNKPCANIIKKKVVKKVKKKVVSVSGSPSAPVTKVQEGVANDNGSKTGADSTLSSSKTYKKSEDKVQDASSRTMADAYSQPCQNALDASVVKRAAIRQAVCSDGISIPKVDKRNGIPPSTNLSGPKITKPLNAGSVVDDKNSDLSADIGARKSDGEGPVSSSGTKAGVGLQSLDGANAPRDDSAALKSLLNPVGSSAEMVHSCLSGFENSREMYQRPVNADSSNFDKDIKQSEEQVPSSGSGTKDGVHLQSLDGVIEPVKNIAAAVVESLPCPLVSSVDTPPVKKKKSVMDRLSGFPSSRAINERPINADSCAHCADPALSSDKGLRQFEQKSAPSGAHTVDNVGFQSLNGKTVAPGESEAVQSQFIPVVGSPGTLNIKKEKPKRKKKFMNNFSGDSSSRVTDVNERSEKEGTVSVIKTINAVALPEVTVPLEKSAGVESFTKHGFESFDKSKVGKREKVTKVSGTSSSRVLEVHEKLTNADGQTDGVGGSLSLDKGLKQSVDEVTTSAMQTIDDDVSQFLHEVSLSLQKQSKVGSISSSAIDSCAMDKINTKPFPDLSSLRPYDIHERMVNADSLVHCSDASLTSDKDLSQSEAEVEGSLIKDTAVRPSPIYLDDSVGTYAKINEKQNSITPPSSQPTKMSDEPSKSDTLDYNMDAATSFDEGQKKSESKPMISGIGNLDDACSQPLDCVPASQNSQQERPPAVTDVVRDGLDDGVVRSSMHSYVGPISMFEDSTSRDLHSRYLLGLEDNQRDDSSFMTVSDSPMYDPLDETIELESGVTREGQTDVYEAGEHGMLGQEDLEDIGLHSQMHEVSNNNLVLEHYNPVLDERPPVALVKDGLPLVSNPSSSVTKPLLSSISNHNKEAMDSIPERHVTTDPCRSSFAVPEAHIMNSEQSQCQLPSKKDGKGNGLNNEGLDQTVHDHSNPENLSLTSKQSGQPSSGLKPKVGVASVKKAFQVTPVPKVLPGRASFASGKGPDSVTRVTGPRTWRRMDNPSPFSRQESGLSTGPSQRKSPKKFGKIQSTSYVRKGNSLVRKFAPTASPSGSGVVSTSSYQFSHMVNDESKRSAVCGDKLNCVEPRNGSGTGFERSRTSPLPRNTSPPNGAASSSQANTSLTSADPLVEDCSESTLDPACDKPENQDAGPSDQDGVSDKPETPSTLDSGKPKSSAIKGTTYVKRKSNQLVASCNTVGDYSVGVSENIQPLRSSASYDQYYKKKRNQLIRNSPSLGSYLMQACSVPDDSSNAENQRDLKVSSMKCSRNPSKRRDKALVKKFSMVWTLNGTQNENEETNPLYRGKVFPHLFPWKRIAHWRNSVSNITSVSRRSPFSLISKKLLLSRKRDTVYTRSTGGFSLRKAKVLSIGGSHLKWSKSIESRSKKANEEATLAVAAVEKKKRECKGAGRAITSAKNKSRFSRKSSHSIKICPGERIFRIGSVRYKMDPSKRTLQRIPDENSSSAVDTQSGKDSKRSFIPKRLLIGNDEYIRIGNGNQLVRDPKKLVRILASEKVRWSLHTARLRMAKKQQYCQFFTRFGKCNKSSGKCPYIHDPDKIAVCTKFLKGSCSNTNCTLTHKVIPERMEDCSYFLQGLCTKEKCPYRHVNVNPNAPVCEGFLRGYCADGNECCKKHTYVCPQFESTGECPQRPMCKLHHPKNQNRSRKRKRSKDLKSVAGRYFGSRLIDSCQTGLISSNKHSDEQNEDIFSHEGRFTNYISLDVGDAEVEYTDDPVTKFDDSELSDVQSNELEELMKPLHLMNRISS